MHPGIAYFFAPQLLFLMGAIFIPIEALFRRFWFAPDSSGRTVATGVFYCSLLIQWAFPGISLASLAINPVTLRWLFGRLWRAHPSGTLG
jgi:hypothetical protein